MDYGLLKKNGAEPEMPSYEVVGDAIDYEQRTELKIVCEHSSRISVEKVLRAKLGLTRKEFEHLVSTRTIRLENGANIYKTRVKREIVLRVGPR